MWDRSKGDKPSALEFADALRNLGTDTDFDERESLEERIEELEKIIESLTEQLADKEKAKDAAEAIAAQDGFRTNFRKSAGKASGYAAGTFLTTAVSMGIPAAAVFFLGADNPLVSKFLSAAVDASNK